MNGLELVRNLSLAIVACIVLGPAPDVAAGQFNPKLNIGDAAPAWKALEGVGGQHHSLSDLEKKHAIVVVFTCNSCPYAVDVEDRLVALHKKYADRDVALVAINVNKVEEDLMPAMKEKADAKGFNFAYLFDETQQIARDYGATRTPEFFVIDKNRKVVYMGAMDDSPTGDAVTKRHVELAIESVLSESKLNVEETIPIGCAVRYKRARRSRRVKKED